MTDEINLFQRKSFGLSGLWGRSKTFAVMIVIDRFFGTGEQDLDRSDFDFSVARLGVVSTVGYLTLYQFSGS